MYNQYETSFLTQVFLPITMGMAALFYTFAFTFFKNLLHELDEYLKNETKNKTNNKKEESIKKIKIKKEYHNIVDYCNFGELIMHLLFWWCTLSFLFGILSNYGVNQEISEQWYFRIILGMVFVGLCLLPVALIYRDENNKEIKVIGLGTALLLAVPSLGSLVFLFLIFFHKLCKILPAILLFMLTGLVFYLIYWFLMSLKYYPLRSLQKLRGTTP